MGASETREREPAVTAPVADEAARLAERLVPVLSRATGWDAPRAEGLVRLSGGVSRETWRLDAVAGRRRRALILQRQRSFGSGSWLDPELEARVLRAARAAGVPCAEPLAWSTQPEYLSLPYLLVEYVDGETIPQRILRDPRFAPARAKLARQYGEALGRIQRVGRGELPDLPPQDPLAHYQEILDGIGKPSPALALGFRWLALNRPPAGDPVVVHGDFRNGNGIVDPALGLRAVIDWELAHLGDPLEDLGWFCIRAWRFGEPLRAGGFGRTDDIIAGYEATSGRKVDRESLRWWNIMGTVRWAVICLIQGAAHSKGIRRSLEHAVTGRRAAEAEFDLMLLLP